VWPGCGGGNTCSGWMCSGRDDGVMDDSLLRRGHTSTDHAVRLAAILAYVGSGDLDLGSSARSHRVDIRLRVGLSPPSTSHYGPWCHSPSRYRGAAGPLPGEGLGYSGLPSRSAAGRRSTCCVAEHLYGPSSIEAYALAVAGLPARNLLLSSVARRVSSSSPTPGAPSSGSAAARCDTV